MTKRICRVEIFSFLFLAARSFESQNELSTGYARPACQRFAEGQGWSPYVWAILSGVNQITLCLLEANDPVDSGAIWLKTEFFLEGHELLPEINEKLFAAELSLMTQAVEQFGAITPTAQCGDPGPYMPKRTPKDSRLDPNKTLAEQFDLLRVVDSTRYPAFFDYRGKRYLLTIEKGENE